MDFKLEILRQHRPPPNASIIELWQFPDPDRDPEWLPDSDADCHQNVISWFLCHTQALHKIPSKSVGNSIIKWIRISDFGLLDPDGDPDRHQNWIHWSLGYVLPLQEISSKSVHNFFSYPTDRQTNRQTDRSENITSFGGGNNELHLAFRRGRALPLETSTGSRRYLGRQVGMDLAGGTCTWELDLWLRTRWLQ